MRVRGWDYFEHLKEDCDDILEIVGSVSVAEFKSRRNVHKAAVCSLLSIGELLKSFSAEERDAMPEIPWKRLIGFRDRAAHGYQHLNLDIVWELIALCVPELAKFLSKPLNCRMCGQLPLVSRKNERYVIPCACGNAVIGGELERQADVIIRWNTHC